jgi:hypothetical protein
VTANSLRNASELYTHLTNIAPLGSDDHKENPLPAETCRHSHSNAIASQRLVRRPSRPLDSFSAYFIEQQWRLHLHQTTHSIRLPSQQPTATLITEQTRDFSQGLHHRRTQTSAASRYITPSKPLRPTANTPKFFRRFFTFIYTATGSN